MCGLCLCHSFGASLLYFVVRVGCRRKTVHVRYLISWWVLVLSFRYGGRWFRHRWTQPQKDGELRPQICINILQMPYLLFTPYQYHVAADKPTPAQNGDKFRSIFSDNLQPIATRGKKARGMLLVDQHCHNGCSIKRAPLSDSCYNEISGGHIGRGLFGGGVLPAHYCPCDCALWMCTLEAIARRVKWRHVRKREAEQNARPSFLRTTGQRCIAVSSTHSVSNKTSWYCSLCDARALHFTITGNVRYLRKEATSV